MTRWTCSFISPALLKTNKYSLPYQNIEFLIKTRNKRQNACSSDSKNPKEQSKADHGRMATISQLERSQRPTPNNNLMRLIIGLKNGVEIGDHKKHDDASLGASLDEPETTCGKWRDWKRSCGCSGPSRLRLPNLNKSGDPSRRCCFVFDDYIQMGICQKLDKVKLCQLLTNIGGIYILYFISGVLHESVFKNPYLNWVTQKQEKCTDSFGILIVPFLVAWAMAALYNHFFVRDRVQIPRKNGIMTGAAVVVASTFSMLAIQKTSFPVVIMFESCSIVPVVLIGVFCSRVRDSELKLGPKKMIVTAIIVVGILLFQFFDPETREGEVKQEFIGFIFLLFHFVAEGFLPDLQAEIKVEFKPLPTEMMEVINKWCSIISAALLVVSLQIWSFPLFLLQHPLFTIDLFALSVLSGAGQFFVYRMIKQFKQHFVPFTISSRKILTVVISIIFYHHETNWQQVVGVLIVLSAVAFDFLTEISKKQPAPKDVNIELHEEVPEQKITEQKMTGQKSDSTQRQKQNQEGHQQNQEGHQPQKQRVEPLNPVFQT